MRYRSQLDAPVRRPPLLMWALRQSVLLLGFCLALWTGCGEGPHHLGRALWLSGDHKDWSEAADAELLWFHPEDGQYHGQVFLPGRVLRLRLYSPTHNRQVGVESTEPIHALPCTQAAVVGVQAAPFRLATPLSARYALTFDPDRATLRIDLAPDAELDLTPPGAALAAAVRGSDRLTSAQQRQRAQTLAVELDSLAADTPLIDATQRIPTLTFLDFEARPGQVVSLLADFNQWTPGQDPLFPTLGGQLSYLARPHAEPRLTYRLARTDQSFPDPRNRQLAIPDVRWPVNPLHALGGNLGDFLSLVLLPPLPASQPQLQCLRLPPGPYGLREAYVLLPAAAAASPAAPLPTLYIHDGKDALLRGRYDRVISELIAQAKLPPLVAVFLPAPDAVLDRLTAYSHVRDLSHPDLSAKGAEHARYLLDEVVPAVEKSYPAAAPRAMLGIDLAGPFSFALAWQDPQNRVVRLISQAGRFGWGAWQDNVPYRNILSQDRSRMLVRASLDWRDGEHPQVQAQALLPPVFVGPGYRAKVRFSHHMAPVAPDWWDDLRERLPAALTFVFADLLTPLPLSQ